MKEVDLNDLSSEVLETFFDSNDINNIEEIEVQPKKDKISLKRPQGTSNEMLLQEIKNGINVDKNKELLIRYNYPLAVSIAKRCKCFIPEEDKISYAVEGLLNSIHNFDPTKGVLFSTYASSAIHMMVMNKSNEHNSMIYVPRYVSVYNVNIRKFCNEYEKKHQSKASPELISKELGIDIDQVRLCLAFQVETTSLNSSSDDDSTSLIDTIPSHYSTETSDVFDIVVDMINELEDKEIEIISRIHGINGYTVETFESISSTGFFDKNGKQVTARSTLHYKYEAAMAKLKKAVRRKGLTIKDI